MELTDPRYARNRIYITNEEQALIKRTSILLGGAGIGSVIAECLLRMGFENLTIIDGDVVELSNLNRQNYTELDLLKPKTEALKKRLLAINKNANITAHHCFLTPDNVTDYISNHDIAINALDFSTEVPLLFDKTCQNLNIPILHPYNLGWGALVLVVGSRKGLDTLCKTDKALSELKVVEYASGYSRFWGDPVKWLEDVIEKYKKEKEPLPPPQLSIASWLVASMCTQIAFDIVTKKPVKTFPEFYLNYLN